MQVRSILYQESGPALNAQGIGDRGKGAGERGQGLQQVQVILWGFIRSSCPESSIHQAEQLKLEEALDRHL